MPKATGKKQTAQPGDKRLGNKFWEARYNHGRKPKTESPSTLWNAAVEYFKWVEANPLFETKVISHQGEGYDHAVAKMRAPTLQGLWIFLGITPQTWYNWKERKGFLEVMTRVDNVLYDWKFAGAAADLLNANIIARDLKLKDYGDLTSDDKPVEGLRVEHV
jgi:hypothetical protein